MRAPWRLIAVLMLSPWLALAAAGQSPPDDTENGQSPPVNAPNSPEAPARTTRPARTKSHPRPRLMRAS